MLRDASLGRRLLVGAAVFITVALVIAAIAIGFVLHRFVQGQIDQRLDTEIVFLASMLRADTGGTLGLAGSADGPPFDRPARGWYWQVNGPSNALRSRSLGDATLDVPALPSPPGPPPPSPKRDDRPPAGERPRPADGPGPDGVPLHFRVQSLSVSGIPATLIASAPRDAVIGPWREAMATLALSLAALGVALVLAIVLQVRLGLRPLERLRRALADVRAGRSEARARRTAGRDQAAGGRAQRPAGAERGQPRTRAAPRRQPRAWAQDAAGYACSRAVSPRRRQRRAQRPRRCDGAAHSASSWPRASGGAQRAGAGPHAGRPSPRGARRSPPQGSCESRHCLDHRRDAGTWRSPANGRTSMRSPAISWKTPSNGPAARSTSAPVPTRIAPSRSPSTMTGRACGRTRSRR